ncbi:MAG: methyltransferase domain-containing protein [Bacteroidetes bacterium]|nr:methyltransferase domain-containing protein [Bacteroidota bacterium]
MRFQSYFNTAIKIIHAYDGKIPLHHYLKQYFAQHKKHGSTDRKIIANACYNFYRTGHSLNNLSVEEKLKYSIFICNDAGDGWDFLFDGAWLNKRHESIHQRISFAEKELPAFSLVSIFPFVSELSETINSTQFIQSLFIQPDVFIRLRPAKKNTVIRKLDLHGLKYSLLDEDTIAFSPSVKIDTVIQLDDEAVIQDYSSQRVSHLFRTIIADKEKGNSSIEVWDCCAASGGKSILANDILQNIRLTVSDLRNSIIKNLQQRFQIAGIKDYTSIVADVTRVHPKKQFDLIICDAPCTGSGTWGRTPEQLYFFSATTIDAFASLQKNIVSNVIPSLKEGGYFLYITCSVFKKENEALVDFIQQHCRLHLMQKEILAGYTAKADTMYAVLFKRNH